MSRYALRLRELPFRTVTEHVETWLELASAGQFDGQDDHHIPPAWVGRHSANTLNAASLPTVFSVPYAPAAQGTQIPCRQTDIQELVLTPLTKMRDKPWASAGEG